MKRDYPDRPIVGVGAVIIERERVVVVRRATEPLRGQWSIPGGVLEIGETLRQGTEREVLEETGLVIEAGEVLEVFDRIVPDGEGKVQFHYVLVDFLCRRVSGDLRAGSDVSEARWVASAYLDALGIEAPAAAVIRKGLDRSTE